MKNLSSIITPELISAERAEEWLAIAAHGDDFRCPACGVAISTNTYFAGFTVRCKQCHKKYTWRTGTMFEGMKLSAADVIILFDRMRLGMTDGEIAESTDINIETVKIWRYKYGILFNQCNQ